MQQLNIVHKKVKTTNQVVSEKPKQELENKRERKGLQLALSRKVYRILNSDTFYVESESTNNLYYFVRYNPSVFEICSCPDSWIRHVKCKHIFAIEHVIRKGNLIDVEKLPAEAKRDNMVPKSKSYSDDDYDF